MALIKLNNRAVKDITEFGSISSLGSLTHISTATASASASIEFTSGIDSTYKEYVFYFVNIHPATDGGRLVFNMSTDSGSNYNVTKTTTFFRAEHNEADTFTSLAYKTSDDLAQSTSDQFLTAGTSNNNDDAVSGYLHLYNPSSTTFVKHFVSRVHSTNSSSEPFSMDDFIAGYGNTTSAVDAVKFQMSSGNIDSGQILLFGIN
jgi:hypothetical protein